ncbi:MAG: hypothetical protein KFB97_03780 [Cyanobium sp. M30B3]|nr:MAG: hypothetical protein KFB97_03780 [Cyanobium sp. M30B3]
MSPSCDSDANASSLDAEVYADLQASCDINIDSCKRVCLILGPYRNLTTLTASTLFLHPNCQVLNHARDRVFRVPQVNFLSSYSLETFERFIKYAILISGKGQRGKHGGSITFSHAFDPQYGMSEVFNKKGFELIKKNIDCLLWKESLEASNLIRDYNVNLDELLNSEPRLVFLLPIRYPLDCALSNLKTGHALRFQGINDSISFQECLDAILREIYWFLSLQRQYKDRFYHYYSHSINREMLVGLARFLSLTPNDDWISSALEVMIVKSGYRHSDSLVKAYRDAVEAIFSDMPCAAEHLLHFC